MQKVLKLEGLHHLIKIYRRCVKEFGEEKILSIIENKPHVFFDFLNEDFIIDLDHFNGSPKLIMWTEENVSFLIEELDFTILQANILITIYEKKEPILIDYIIEKCRNLFPDNDRKKGRKEGSVIGGALAGLKRKCLSKNIEIPYESSEDENGVLKYFLKENNRDIIIKHLKKLKF